MRRPHVEEEMLILQAPRQNEMTVLDNLRVPEAGEIAVSSGPALQAGGPEFNPE